MPKLQKSTSRKDEIPKGTPKTLEDLQRWIMNVSTPMTSWNKVPILANTGTMKFTIIGMAIQHGGPLDGAIVLKMGEPA